MKLPAKASKPALGKRLRAWRKDKGLKSYEVAAAIEVSQGAWSEIENGISHPSYSTLYKLIHTYPEDDMTWIIFVI